MNWILGNDNKMLLKALCDSYAPSSDEVRAQRVIAKHLIDRGLECYGDAIGNLYASTNSASDFHIGIIAYSYRNVNTNLIKM